jgi:hypothetical protein
MKISEQKLKKRERDALTLLHPQEKGQTQVCKDLSKTKVPTAKQRSKQASL